MKRVKRRTFNVTEKEIMLELLAPKVQLIGANNRYPDHFKLYKKLLGEVQREKEAVGRV